MFKFNRVVCALAVCAIVSVAFGAAVKIKAITPYNGENSDADGMAIVNYHPGNNTTEVQVVITDFATAETYGVVVSGIDPYGNRVLCKDEPNAITPNPVGNGTFHGTCPDDLSANPIVIIYVDDETPYYGGSLEPDNPEGELEIRGVGRL